MSRSRSYRPRRQTRYTGWSWQLSDRGSNTRRRRGLKHYPYYFGNSSEPSHRWYYNYTRKKIRVAARAGLRAALLLANTYDPATEHSHRWSSLEIADYGDLEAVDLFDADALVRIHGLAFDPT